MCAVSELGSIICAIQPGEGLRAYHQWCTRLRKYLSKYLISENTLVLNGFCFAHSCEVHTYTVINWVLVHFPPDSRPVRSASALSLFLPFPLVPLPFFSISFLTSPYFSSASSYFSITFTLLPTLLSPSKDTRGSSWVAASFSFPLMLSNHSAVVLHQGWADPRESTRSLR